MSDMVLGMYCTCNTLATSRESRAACDLRAIGAPSPLCGTVRIRASALLYPVDHHILEHVCVGVLDSAEGVLHLTTIELLEELIQSILCTCVTLAVMGSPHTSSFNNFKSSGFASKA